MLEPQRAYLCSSVVTRVKEEEVLPAATRRLLSIGDGRRGVRPRIFAAKVLVIVDDCLDRGVVMRTARYSVKVRMCCMGFVWNKPLIS